MVANSLIISRIAVPLFHNLLTFWQLVLPSSEEFLFSADIAAKNNLSQI